VEKFQPLPVQAFCIAGEINYIVRMKDKIAGTRTIAFFILFTFFTSCNGQNKPYTAIDDVREQKATPTGQPGLIKNQRSQLSDNVHCGLQDKAGSLWFGTIGDGVYRYDGKLFFNYTMKEGLNSNTVWSILEDKSGNIWIGTDAGACRFDGKTFTTVPITANNNPFNLNNSSPISISIKNNVWSMMQDKHGIIWFGTTEGVYCYDGKKITRFLDNDSVINKDGLQLKMVDRILEDKNGVIWFASGMPPGMEGICRFDGKTLTGSKPNGDGWIRTITEDKNGNLWFGGRQNGNFLYNGKNFVRFTEKTGIGNAVLADKSGKIWFTGNEGDNNYESQDGVWCYDGKTFTNFTTKDGMGKYFVHFMLEDSNGNIWIGTRNTGLYKYDGKNFSSF
jgi:streptogramin lyase